MSVTESIPLLIIVLLLVAVSGTTVEQMTVTFEGTHQQERLDDAHVVAGGAVTVPETAAVTGSVYVIGGTARIEGTLEGDVTILAGNLTVAEGATVTGTVQQFGGESRIAPTATVGTVTAFEPPTQNDSLAGRTTTVLLQFLLVGTLGWVLVRRRPTLLENVGQAITGHTLVSLVVGVLAATALLVLFVYMAFTLVLLPVSILGLGAEVLIVVYGQVAFGHLVGQRLPIERQDVATVAGIGVLVIGIELLGLIPMLGGLLQLAVIAIGFGAVVNTYFGFTRFEPATIG